MNKFLAALLSLTLVLGSAGIAFADEVDANDTTGVEASGEAADGEDAETPADETQGEDAAAPEAGLTDIAGTVYAEAVTALYNKKIVTGDPAGTFRPEDSITRAEACVIIVKAMGATEAEQAAAADSGFTDLADYDWAKNVINYAAEKGIVSGDGGGTFRPAGEVTFAEMAVMLIKAQGISADEVTGEWPANYINKATELGMLANVSVTGEIDGNAAASRGNVAVMAYAALEAIEAAGQEADAPADNTDADAADGEAGGEAADGEGAEGTEGTDGTDGADAKGDADGTDTTPTAN